VRPGDRFDTHSNDAHDADNECPHVDDADVGCVAMMVGRGTADGVFGESASQEEEEERSEEKEVIGIECDGPD
jgi:hypothetical protein